MRNQTLLERQESSRLVVSISRMVMALNTLMAMAMVVAMVMAMMMAMIIRWMMMRPVILK